MKGSLPKFILIGLCIGLAATCGLLCRKPAPVAPLAQFKEKGKSATEVKPQEALDDDIPRPETFSETEIAFLANSVQDSFKFWADDDPQSLWLWAYTLKNREAKRVALKLIISRWTLNDPEKTLQWLEKEEESKLTSSLYSTLGRSWAKSNPAVAISRLSSLENEQARQEALSGCIYHIASKDPAKASLLLESLKTSSEYETLLFVCASKWSEVDHKKALDWSSTLENPYNASTKRFIYIRWMKSKPQEALNSIQKDQELLTKEDFLLTEILQVFINAQKKQPLELIENIKNDKVRTAILGHFALALLDTNIDQAIDLIAKLPAKEQRYFLSKALLLSSSTSAISTKKLTAQLKSQPLNTNEFIRLWILTQPLAAMDWLNSPDTPLEEELRQELITESAQAWAKTNFKQASLYLFNIQNDQLRTRYIWGLLSSTPKNMSKRAPDLCNSLSDLDDRTKAYTRFALSIADKMPAVAANILEKKGDTNLKNVFAIMKSFAKTKPQQSYRWFKQFSANPFYPFGIAFLSFEWARKDHSSALIWARGLQKEELHKRALLGIALYFRENTTIQEQERWLTTLKTSEFVHVASIFKKTLGSSQSSPSKNTIIP